MAPNSPLKLLSLMGMTALVAGASAAPTFWNTGQGLQSFDRDLHWTAEKVQGSSNFQGAQQAWVMDTQSYPVLGQYNRRDYTNSQWISFSRDGYCANNDIFRFTTTFEIPTTGSGGSGGSGGTGSGNNQTQGGGDAFGYTFKGKFSSDNASEMYVNGQLVSGLPFYGELGYSFEAAKAFDASAYLREGINTVSFLVGSADTMGGNAGPVTEWMGLRVEGAIQAVPEPASMAVVATGFAALMRRRKR